MVCRLDPVREKIPFVSLIPEVLVQVSVGDLLQRLDIVDWNDVRVKVHKLNSNFLEASMAEQVALDARKCLMRIVICLLNQS